MSENTWAMLGVMPGGDEELSPLACRDRSLTYLSEQDQRKLRREFDNLASAERQMQHLFREVLSGAFLARQGFAPRYEPEMMGQTPDWHFKSDELGEFIAEFRNFESPGSVRTEQQHAIGDDGQGTWSGSIPDHTVR